MLFAVAIWWSDSERESALAGLGLILGVIMVPTGLVWLRREQRYFDARNGYWIEIGEEEFALVTPDGTDRSNWASLTPFEVKRTTVHRPKIGEDIVVHSTVARYGNLEVNIPWTILRPALTPTRRAERRRCAPF